MISSSPFRTSWLYWFKCPHCAYVSYSTSCRGEVSERPPRLLIRYRCKRCGQDSRLEHPRVISLVAFAMSVVSFVAIYYLMWGAGGWGLPVVPELLLTFAAVTALQFVFMRFTHKYVPLARSEL